MTHIPVIAIMSWFDTLGIFTYENPESNLEQEYLVVADLYARAWGAEAPLEMDNKEINNVALRVLSLNYLNNFIFSMLSATLALLIGGASFSQILDILG